MFGMFAGIYHWFPKFTGRVMSEFWGKVHFWLTLIFMNLVFMPMFAQGMAGMLRRMSDGGANYAAATVKDTSYALSNQIIHLNTVVSIAVWLLGGARPYIRANSTYSFAVSAGMSRHSAGLRV